MQESTITKGWLEPRWTTLVGQDTQPVDAYGAIPEPDAATLISLYEDTVYICANWLSDHVASAPLKVYVKDVKTKGIAEEGIARRQVIDHSLVRLLDMPNEHMSCHDFLKYIDTQLSLTGDAYVHIVREEDGLPCALFPLLTQHCKLGADKGQIVGVYYQVSSPPVFYPNEDIIHFRLMDQRNPYTTGYSPVRAVYERILLAKNELAYLNSLFRNQARPDSLLTVKGATPEQLERLQKETNMRFKQGGIGGIMALDAEDMDLKNLNWSPKDVLGTELYKYTKLQIINAFKLNPALFDSESSNRAVAHEARAQGQRDAVQPRLRLIEEKLNQRLVPEFDDRFIIAFDDPVEEDEDFEHNKRKDWLAAGVYTVDEVRKLEGLPPLAQPPPQQPIQPQEGTSPQQDNPPGPGGDDPEAQTDAPIASNDLRSTVGGLQAIASLQASFYAGQIPREAAMANTRILFGFTVQEAEALFPAIAPQKLTPAETTPPPEGAL